MLPVPLSKIARPQAAMVLVGLSVFVPTLQASRVANLDDFSEDDQLILIDTVAAETRSSVLTSGTDFSGVTRNLSLDVAAVPAGRSVEAEVYTPRGFLAVAQGPGVGARTWLEYITPPGDSLDLTLANAANTLEVFISYSQTPFDLEVTVESQGGTRESHTYGQLATNSPTRSQISFADFINTDFSQVNSLTLDMKKQSGQGAPDFIVTNVAVSSDLESIPEPSVALLSLLAAAGFLAQRKRN